MLFCRRGTARYTVLIVLIVAVVGILLVTSNGDITGNATKSKLSKAKSNCRTAQENYKRCLSSHPALEVSACDSELGILKTLRCKIPSRPLCQNGAIRNSEYCPDSQTLTRRNICRNGRWIWETVLPAEQCPQQQAPAPEEQAEQGAEPAQEAPEYPPVAQAQQRPAPQQPQENDRCTAEQTFSVNRRENCRDLTCQVIGVDDYQWRWVQVQGCQQEQQAPQEQQNQQPPAEQQAPQQEQQDACRPEEAFTIRNEQRCPEGTIYRWQICTLEGRWVWENIAGVVCAGNQPQGQQEQAQQQQPQQEQQPAPQQRQQDLAREGQACSRPGDCVAGLVCYEVWPGFSECKRDTDGDGVIDDDEAFFETDPNDPASNLNDRDGDGTANANDATPCGQHATFQDRCSCDAGWFNGDGNWNTGCESEQREGGARGIYFS